MDSFDEMLKAGYDMDVDLSPIRGTSFEYFKHVAGDYKGYLGKLTVKYVNADGKSCAKNDATAKVSHGILDLIVAESPDKHGLVNGQVPPEANYGALIFKQYISLDQERAWQVARLLEGLTFPQAPNSSAVVLYTEDKKKFEINFKNLALFYGAPIIWKLSEGKKSSYLDGMIILVNPSVPDNATFENRKTFMNKLYVEFDRILKEEEAKRKADKDEVEKTPDAPAVSADTILGDYE